jgi:hypothetical protein
MTRLGLRSKRKLKKKVSAEQRAAEFAPTYFFGYGSLLTPIGIHGRGMLERYKFEDLIPCSLNGYARSMCAFFAGRNFYGLLEDDKAHCNGIVFKIRDWYDYRALLISEGATSGMPFTNRTYWPLDVTKLISGWDVPKDHRVVTLLCKHDRSSWGRVQRSYISLCDRAAEKLGPDFRKEFLKTGGIPFEWKQMKAIAKRHNIRTW